MPLIVKFGVDPIGKMYDEDFPKMNVGELVYMNGKNYIVHEVKHFADAGKGIKEYKKFTEDYNYFTRYIIKEQP